MLVVPWLAGVVVAGFRWPQLPLLGAWLTGYLFTYYALQAVKTRRPSRVQWQLALYGPITAALAVVVVTVRPQVLSYAPVFAALLAVNVYYARLRRERALVNDLSAVAQSCLMVFVVATAAGVSVARVVPVFVIVALYFTGTVFYVKTMIRERGNAAYFRMSVLYHVLAFVVVLSSGVLSAVLFAVLLARAAALPRYRLAPKQVGIVEIGCCLGVLAAVVAG